MASVTFPTTLGGDGSTVTDDGNATTGLANGGHRSRFVPALAQMVAVANGGVTQTAANASAAASSANSAAASAASAVLSPGATATSTSSIAIGTGSKSLTLAQTGKNFAVGMYVQIVNTADTTRWMIGAITAFTSGTGAMTVNVTNTNSTGTYAAWAVSVATPPTQALPATPVPTIVFLTSGTSWTVPAGVTRVKATIVGAGGSGRRESASVATASGGGSGGVVVEVFTVTPGAGISYSVGAGGTGPTVNGTNGNAGGSTTFNGVSAGGGGGGTTTTGAGGTATGGDANFPGAPGLCFEVGSVDVSVGGDTPLGLGKGQTSWNNSNIGQAGYGYGSAGQYGATPSAGGNGVIILEY